MTNIRFFARSTVAAACAVLTMAAVPAFASHEAGSHDIANAQKLEVHNDGKGHVVYCAVLPAVTGTIMNSNKVCKSVAEWKSRGVNVPTDDTANTGA